MSRRPITLTLAVLSAAAIPALSSAVSGAAGATVQVRPAAAGATVQVRHTNRGDLLVNGHGFTLYAFSRDTGGHSQCARISGCRSVWPMDTTHGRPVAGGGVQRSLLGTIRVGSTTQVTYAGHPMYTYSGDGSPGDTSYIGVTQFRGRWSGLRASGRRVG